MLLWIIVYKFYCSIENRIPNEENSEIITMLPIVPHIPPKETECKSFVNQLNQSQYPPGTQYFVYIPTQHKGFEGQRAMENVYEELHSQPSAPAYPVLSTTFK